MYHLYNTYNINLICYGDFNRIKTGKNFLKYRFAAFHRCQCPQVMSAAKSAATLLSGMIPDLSVDISTPSLTLLEPTKLFCVEAGG